MKSFLIQYETGIRLSFFLGTLLIMSLLEFWMPKRALTVSKLHRWMCYITIVFLDTLIIRLLFPAAAVGVAYFSETHGWGLFHYYPLPLWIAILSSVILLDLSIYLQHVALHAVPLLWRVHRMHHADLDIDVTTGIRFHPIEIVLSMLIKFAVITALGAPVAAVIIFEILLNATSMFNHSNIRLPLALDRILRWITVTPDMHRVHHSIERSETNSNFGFNLSWWDHLFGTYQEQPRAGHRQMVIGIENFRNPRYCIKLVGMLVIPFIRKN